MPYLWTDSRIRHRGPPFYTTSLIKATSKGITGHFCPTADSGPPVTDSMRKEGQPSWLTTDSTNWNSLPLDWWICRPITSNFVTCYPSYCVFHLGFQKKSNTTWMQLFFIYLYSQFFRCNFQMTRRLYGRCMSSIVFWRSTVGKKGKRMWSL